MKKPNRRAHNAVWDFCPLKDLPLLVMLALADECDDEFVCSMSMPALAHRARMSENGARNILKWLIAHKYAEIVTLGHGRGNSSVYRIHPAGIENPWILPPENPHAMHLLAEAQNPHNVQVFAEENPHGKGVLAEAQNPHNMQVFRGNAEENPQDMHLLAEKNPHGKGVFPNSFHTLSKRESNNPNGLLHSSAKNENDGTANQKTRFRYTDADALLVYKAYPRKRDKTDAIKAIKNAIRRICKGEDKPEWWTGQQWPPPDPLAWLLERTQIFAQSMEAQQQEPDKIKYPATWFNKGSYQDHERDWQYNRRQPAGHFGNGYAPAQRESNADRARANAARYGAATVHDAPGAAEPVGQNGRIIDATDYEISDR